MVSHAKLEKLDVAKRRTLFAQRSRTELFSGKTPSSDLERKWVDFLIHWNGALEFCIKTTEGGNTQHIAEKIKGDRKRDPKIQYLFQARNSTEHVGKVVDPQDGMLSIGSSRQQFISMNFGDHVESIRFEENVMVNKDGILSFLPNFRGGIIENDFVGEKQSEVSISLTTPYLRLITVTNRSQTYSVPDTGGTIDQVAKVLSGYALKYLEALIKEIDAIFDQ